MPLPVGPVRGKSVIVTGANRGIGLATVAELLGRGARVAAGVREVSKMPKLDGDLFVHRLDTADTQSCQAFVNAVHATFGRIDALINNAAILIDQSTAALSLSEEDLRLTLEVNVLGPFRMAKLVLPIMKNQGYGRIVNISSGLGALNGMGGGTPAYRMSKSALNALTRILAAEAAPSGNIKVNSLNPGWVKTEMGGAGAVRESAEPAREIADLALLAVDGPTGGFFLKGEPIAW